MGQAAVDLPDPLSPPASADGPVNADDLLAQMAGEEIDRLLAEQEVERSPKPARAATPNKGTPAPSSPSNAANPPAQPNPPESDALTGVLGQIAPESEIAPDAVATLASAPQATAEGKSAAELLDEELAADEARAALSSARFQADPDAGGSEASSPLPLPLRVLAWVSAPLDACPDHVREAIGKIAIITAVNALAVLFYVLFLRPHHG
jgi:hypothetical protein